MNLPLKCVKPALEKKRNTINGLPGTEERRVSRAARSVNSLAQHGDFLQVSFLPHALGPTTENCILAGPSKLSAPTIAVVTSLRHHSPDCASWVSESCKAEE